MRKFRPNLLQPTANRSIGHSNTRATAHAHGDGLLGARTRPMADAGLEDQVMEICGCSREAARGALEAAGPGGVELAVDLVLSTMSTPGFGSAVAAAPSAGSKLVCLVREDLGMGVGKVAAQVAHGALAAHRSALRLAGGEALVREWQEAGEPIIVLKVADMAQLQELLSEAEARGLPTCRVADAGRTEVAPGSVTVGTVGPAAIEAVDGVTGSLSLL